MKGLDWQQPLRNSLTAVWPALRQTFGIGTPAFETIGQGVLPVTSRL